MKNILNRILKTKKRPLSCVQIELTNHCNYNCLCCPHSKPEFKRPRGFMDFYLYKKIIDDSNKVAESVNFSFFGEPLMHPKFLELMDYLKERKMRVVMNTNLSLATKETFQKFIDINLDNLRLSIDAISPETYDIVRPATYFLDLDGNKKETDRFKTICQKAEYWFSLTDHTPTRHVFTVNSVNKKEINQFVKRWYPLLSTKDHVLIKNVLTYGGKIKDSIIKPNPCNAWGINMITVDWQGNVSPCNLDTHMELIIGSAKDNSLLELFQNEKYRKFEQLSKAKKISPCKECIDSNNWTKNINISKGDKIEDDYSRLF